jgi:hypothetical protein
MVRTQIQLTEEQARRLKHLAASQGRSMADLVRSSVDVLLAGAGAADRESSRARALAVSGRFRSGLRDLSARHDRYFAESLEK